MRQSSMHLEQKLAAVVQQSCSHCVPQIIVEEADGPFTASHQGAYRSTQACRGWLERLVALECQHRVLQRRPRPNPANEQRGERQRETDRKRDRDRENRDT